MAASAVPSGEGAASTDVQLRALVVRGFRFLDPRDENGDVLAVVGVRAHHDVLDVVRLDSEDDAVAMRLPATEDVLAPRQVLWQEYGSAHQVLGAMLDLPDSHGDQATDLLVVSRRVSA
ncbi:hypothetical protein BLA60_41250 [Actinophytocola xinjiangensis]|uniref:Uncharacterized protein n=1 Tax=Actinophytocola xinjiangensis TaxID=485602 RepID=A0A7Z1AUC5_9PSEU|nr:hypothetical protein [Actinophytocola xinjiangensis]OLF04354.1 hypothetical protein BLA60_41250 [Actinophytocola xinjiangensis]